MDRLHPEAGFRGALRVRVALRFRPTVRFRAAVRSPLGLRFPPPVWARAAIRCRVAVRFRPVGRSRRAAPSRPGGRGWVAARARPVGRCRRAARSRPGRRARTATSPHRHSNRAWMRRAPAGPGRLPKNRPPRTGPRRPGVGAGIVPNPPSRPAWPRQSGTARSGPAPAAMAGWRPAPGLAGTVRWKPGQVRRQPPVPQAAPAPCLAGPRPTGPTPAPSLLGAEPPNQSGGGAAAQRASLRIRNLILTTGVPGSAGPLAARGPGRRQSSRPRNRGPLTRRARPGGPAAGPRCARRPRTGLSSTTRLPRPAAGSRPGRRGRAAGQAGAVAAGSSSSGRRWRSSWLGPR